MSQSERALSFFDEARARFRATCPASECRAEYYRIAGRTVRIESSAAFSFIDRAFAHLRIAAATQPDLEVCAWDNSASQSAMPPPPWRQRDYGARGEIRGFNDERFRTAFDHMAASLSMYDAERRLAIFWTRDANRLPQADHGAPLRGILHWWAEKNGGLLLHGGAVGNERGAVLLAGQGGAGKSTTALLCASDGMNYLADDYCAVRMEEPPLICSLYQTGKLSFADVPRIFPGARVTVENAGKALLYMNEIDAVRTVDQLPLRAVLIPRITRSATETVITESSSSDAFKAIAPSSLFQLSGAGSTAFQRLACLVAVVPAFQLSLAPDYARITPAIRSFLDSLPA